jgi:hypothetical protein
MNDKKPFVLRLSPDLMAAVQRLSADEFRSANGQIEYILTEYLRKRGYLKQDSVPGAEEGDAD